MFLGRLFVCSRFRGRCGPIGTLSSLCLTIVTIFMFLGNARPCKAGSLVLKIFCCSLPIPTNKFHFQHLEVNSSQFSESSEICYKKLKGKNQSYLKFRYFERATKN